MHTELVQRLFLVAALALGLNKQAAALASHTVFTHTLPARCLVLRSLREPRVSPEPLAVLEEHDSCEMESLISACRPTVLGLQFELQAGEDVRKGAMASATKPRSELAH
jgi:hypothetical protein